MIVSVCVVYVSSLCGGKCAVNFSQKSARILLNQGHYFPESWIVSNAVKINIFEIVLLSLECTCSQGKERNSKLNRKEV